MASDRIICGLGLVAMIALMTGGNGAVHAKAAAKCPFTEASFIGSWSMPAGDEVVKNDAYELEFTKEDGKRVFNSWLHHRPASFGATWEFRDCKVIVADEEMTIEYGFAGHEGKRLVELPATKDGGAFTRVKGD